MSGAAAGPLDRRFRERLGMVGVGLDGNGMPGAERMRIAFVLVESRLTIESKSQQSQIGSKVIAIVIMNIMLMSFIYGS